MSSPCGSNLHRLDHFAAGTAFGVQEAKQLLQAGAIRFCQVDACRLGGVNEVVAVLLLAAALAVGLGSKDVVQGWLDGRLKGEGRRRVEPFHHW